MSDLHKRVVEALKADCYCEEAGVCLCGNCRITSELSGMAIVPVADLKALLDADIECPGAAFAVVRARVSTMLSASEGDK